jgi:hypothetical protein
MAIFLNHTMVQKAIRTHKCLIRDDWFFDFDFQKNQHIGESLDAPSVIPKGSHSLENVSAGGRINLIEWAEPRGLPF